VRALDFVVVGVFEFEWFAARTQKIQQSAPAGSLSPRSIDSDEAQADAQLSAREGGNYAKMTRGSIISSTVMCILMDEIILYFILGSFYSYS
jgi:hypothetical protein